MPFLRYMTLYSWCKYNPDYETILYINDDIDEAKATEVKQNEDGNLGLHRRELLNKENNFLTEAYKLPLEVRRYTPDNLSDKIKDNWESMMPVHKSDLFRWDFLCNTGGFYSDMDILFVDTLLGFQYKLDSHLKDETLLAVSGQPRGFNLKYYPPLITIGFMGSTKENKFFRDVLEVAENSYSPNKYAACGNEALQKIIPYRGGEIFRMWYPDNYLHDFSMKLFYWFSYEQTDAIFKENHELPGAACGIHWYAGANDVQDFVRDLTPNNYKDYDTTICRYLKRVLEH